MSVCDVGAFCAIQVVVLNGVEMLARWHCAVNTGCVTLHVCVGVIEISLIGQPLGGSRHILMHAYEPFHSVLQTLVGFFSCIGKMRLSPAKIV